MFFLWLLSSLGLVSAFDTLSPDSSNVANLDLSVLFKQHDSNSTSYERRWLGEPPAPASDAVWNTAKCKGRKFMAQMSYSDYDVGQSLPTPQSTVRSPWYFAHLGPWGYVMSAVDEVYRNFEAGGYWGVADFFRHLGLSDKCVEEGGKWSAAVITHYGPGSPIDTQTYVGLDGYQRRASGAYFYMAVNPQGGIIVQNTLGPRQAADKVYPNNFPDSELPPLTKLSDMMWAMWEYYVPADQRANLDFFMSLAVSNPTSSAIIRRAFDSEGQGITTTPFMFQPTSDGGLAILGSPNGARVAHFLTQRKLNIGLKTVIGIYVFECLSKARGPCIMFKLGNLAAPIPRPQDTPAQPAPSPGTNPNAPIGRSEVGKRIENKRNVVRRHTFRVDGNGTVSSEYI